MKTNCKKFNTWLENRKKEQGNALVNVCYESNLIDVPKDSWWIGSGATIHVTISLQGLFSPCKPIDKETNCEAHSTMSIDINNRVASFNTTVG